MRETRFSIPVFIDVHEDQEEYPYRKSATVYLGNHLVGFLDNWEYPDSADIAAHKLIERQLGRMATDPIGGNNETY